VDTLLFFQSSAVGVSSTSIQFDMTGLVQNWVLPPAQRTHPQNNENFYLVPDFPTLLLSRVAFYSREDGESRAPKLRIEYTMPPKTR
jgi:hypothetical protein